jgi:type I restriction enzyme S subunit
MKPRQLKVEEFADVHSGGTPSTSNDAYWDGGIPWITPKDLSGYESRYIASGERDISDEGLRNSSAVLLPEETVLLTTRAPIGYVAIAASPLATNQGFKNLVCKREVALPGYVYYLLKRNTELLESYATGATFKELSGARLKAISFQLPSVDIQKRIETLVATYDNLIDNNRKRIALLEEAARQIYREWFIRLRFPGHEHTRIVNGVPAGWGSKKVGDLLAKIESKKKIPKEEYLSEGPIPCVDQSTDFIGGYTDDVDAIYLSPLPMIVFGDHTRVLKYVNFEFARGADGTQLIYPNTDRISIEYLYFALKEIDLSSYFYARHFKFLKEKEVLMPEASLVREYSRIAEPIFAQIQMLRSQSIRLRIARDLLLPRLMSGEIEV